MLSMTKSSALPRSPNLSPSLALQSEGTQVILRDTSSFKKPAEIGNSARKASPKSQPEKPGQHLSCLSRYNYRFRNLECNKYLEHQLIQDTRRQNRQNSWQLKIKKTHPNLQDYDMHVVSPNGVFRNKKKLNLNGADGFAYYWHDMRKSERIISSRQNGGGGVMVLWGFLQKRI